MVIRKMLQVSKSRIVRFSAAITSASPSAYIVQEIAALMNFNATAESLAHIIHAHPTLSEVILTAVRQ